LFNPAKLSEQLFILLCAVPEGYNFPKTFYVMVFARRSIWIFWSTNYFLWNICL